MKDIGFQGEDWVFTIKGDKVLDLDAVDFRVIVYPCGSPSEKVELTKAQCTSLGNNTYRGVIAYSETKKFSNDMYTLEVLVESGDNQRAVFVKRRAIYSDTSASKNIA